MSPRGVRSMLGRCGFNEPAQPYRTPRQNEKPLIDSGFAVGGYSDILEIKKTAHPIRVNGQ